MAGLVLYPCKITFISQPEDSVVALNVKLTSEEISFLEELYVPHSIVEAQ